ncbi:MAG: lipid-A-disaccharide synthase [Nitrospinota bacterium]
MNSIEQLANLVGIQEPPLKRFLVIAGELSGDLYAGRLVATLKEVFPAAKVEGIGGENFRRAGGVTFYDSSEMASVGVKNSLSKIKFYWNVFQDIKKKINTNNYDAVILIDLPDFNLRVAKIADKVGIPIFYYIVPQFWAWRRYRIKTVKKLVDVLFLALPFEQEFYDRYGIDSRFYGHPILDELEDIPSKAIALERIGVTSEKTLIGIMPGSRESEVRTLLPTILEATKIITEKIDAEFIISKSESISYDFINEIVRKSGQNIKIIEADSWNFINSCDFLIAKAGTVTLKIALAGVPMVIVYKLDFISYLLASTLTYSRWVGLPNIIANKKIVPELLQYQMTSHNIATSVISILGNKIMLGSIREEFDQVKLALGDKGACKKAVLAISDFLNRISVK